MIDDDAFVVTDALRLHEAASDLTSVFQLTVINLDDKIDPAYRMYDSIVGPSTQWMDRTHYVAQCYLKALSERVLQHALTIGRLAIWTADVSGERQRDPEVLFAPSRCYWSATLSCGRYIPMQGQPAIPPSYINARLWVKADDWKRERAALVADRERPGGGALPADLAAMLGLGGPAVPVEMPATRKAVSLGALRRFVRNVYEQSGALPHVTRVLTKTAQEHFAPLSVSRTMVQQAVADEGLSRPQSRPKKGPD